MRVWLLLLGVMVLTATFADACIGSPKPGTKGDDEGEGEGEGENGENGDNGENGEDSNNDAADDGKKMEPCPTSSWESMLKEKMADNEGDIEAAMNAIVDGVKSETSGTYTSEVEVSRSLHSCA